MSKVFVINPEKCVGCYSCQIVCKDEHVGNDWSPIAKPQPDTGHFWMKMNEWERGSTPKVFVSYVAKPCQHCKNAPCEKVSDGAVYRREDGLVIIDPEKAKGNKKIMEACPYNAVYWNEELNIPQKCTGCAHLLDDGWEKPRCVAACAHDAILFGEYDEFKDLLEGDEYEVTQLQADVDTQPSVYYLNYPKEFVAGEVADLEEDEVLIGAKVVLTNTETGETCETQTDEFGDFWFKRVGKGVWTLDIEAEGYKPRHITDFLDTNNGDVNTGVIALSKN